MDFQKYAKFQAMPDTSESGAVVENVNTMDAFHCVETPKMAMDSYGIPEIFNSDQGSQSSCSEFLTELRTHDILISMTVFACLHCVL